MTDDSQVHGDPSCEDLEEDFESDGEEEEEILLDEQDKHPSSPAIQVDLKNYGDAVDVPSLGVRVELKSGGHKRLVRGGDLSFAELKFIDLDDPNISEEPSYVYKGETQVLEIKGGLAFKAEKVGWNGKDVVISLSKKAANMKLNRKR